MLLLSEEIRAPQKPFVIVLAVCFITGGSGVRPGSKSPVLAFTTCSHLASFCPVPVMSWALGMKWGGQSRLARPWRGWEAGKPSWKRCLRTSRGREAQVARGRGHQAGKGTEHLQTWASRRIVGPQRETRWRMGSRSGRFLRYHRNGAVYGYKTLHSLITFLSPVCSPLNQGT